MMSAGVHTSIAGEICGEAGANERLALEIEKGHYPM